jgi:hypothetical protein
MTSDERFMLMFIFTCAVYWVAKGFFKLVKECFAIFKLESDLQRPQRQQVDFLKLIHKKSEEKAK